MILSFWLLFCITIHFIECSPHLYRRHHTYYHRSPYHVNYSPYNLPKHSSSFFGVESSLYNDLDENESNEPTVKGGIKNSNQNSNVLIKTPMKLFAERKNGYLSSLGSSYQNKLPDAKRANPSSTKQTSIQESFFPIDTGSSVNNENLSVIELNESNSVKKSSKTNSKSKPSLTTSQTAEPSSTTTAPAKSVPIKILSEKIENTVKEPTLSSNKDIVNSNLDNKSSAIVEQPATTLNSLNVVESKMTTVSSLNVIDNNLEIKEIVNKEVKVNNQDSAAINKLENVIVNELNKNENVEDKKNDALPTVKIENNPNLTEIKTEILTTEDKVSSIVEANVLDVRKPLDQPIDVASNSIKSSVDVAPVSSNTENSLVVEIN